MEPKEVERCTFPRASAARRQSSLRQGVIGSLKVFLCTERATEMNDFQAGHAEFRCALHATDPEWIAVARLRLSDMRRLAPGARVVVPIRSREGNVLEGRGPRTP